MAYLRRADQEPLPPIGINELHAMQIPFDIAQGDNEPVARLPDAERLHLFSHEIRVCRIGGLGISEDAGGALTTPGPFRLFGPLTLLCRRGNALAPLVAIDFCQRAWIACTPRLLVSSTPAAENAAGTPSTWKMYQPASSPCLPFEANQCKRPSAKIVMGGCSPASAMAWRNSSQGSGAGNSLGAVVMPPPRCWSVAVADTACAALADEANTPTGAPGILEWE